MKSPVGTTLLGLLIVAVFGAAAAHIAYRSGQPRPFSPNEEGIYWDKETPFLDAQSDQSDQDVPDQSEPLQVWEKRGFGSMMPAYLLQLYRPDQQIINPSLLFRSSQGRVRDAYTGQG
ncbi:uncharacterized protein LOC123520244 [Portunus trituberculatus]|uniref:uncharacterized protein LOC123520244 n=1 Tax=Portunus trituberculatus TaxID=210409 RepID=UPI001E1CCC6A|nr:uncharacterized protein LOC123520244 [Portunus trituberculatus]